MELYVCSGKEGHLVTSNLKQNLLYDVTYNVLHHQFAWIFRSQVVSQVKSGHAKWWVQVFMKCVYLWNLLKFFEIKNYMYVKNKA